MINDLVITMYVRCFMGAVYYHCFLCFIFLLSAKLGNGVVVLVAGLGHLLSRVLLPFV